MVQFAVQHFFFYEHGRPLVAADVWRGSLSEKGVALLWWEVADAVRPQFLTFCVWPKARSRPYLGVCEAYPRQLCEMPERCCYFAEQFHVVRRGGVADDVLCVCAICGGRMDVSPLVGAERQEVAVVVVEGTSVAPEQSFLLRQDEVWDSGSQLKKTVSVQGAC